MQRRSAGSRSGPDKNNSAPAALNHSNAADAEVRKEALDEARIISAASLLTLHRCKHSCPQH